jgi:hypothetical protein
LLLPISIGAVFPERVNLAVRGVAQHSKANAITYYSRAGLRFAMQGTPTILTAVVAAQDKTKRHPIFAAWVLGVLVVQQVTSSVSPLKDAKSFLGINSSSLKTSDDCGAAMQANEGAIPAVGTFYADVIDTANNNNVVGRCVYELGNQEDCVSNGSYEVESFIHCYMQIGC